MMIEKNKIVSFHYRLSEDGTELEDSHDGEPMLFLAGREGLISGLEQAMQGKQAGDAFSVTLPPEQAYGYRSRDAVQRLPIKKLGTNKKLHPGQVVTVNTGKGALDVTVIKAGKFMVDVDANHPLAGKTLTFDIDIVDVRDATTEEIAHGHAHGAGGHQH
jgi:FKBP-type peptidyl-prolyl cis-trans isomerase SlyD